MSAITPIPVEQWDINRYHEAAERFHKSPADLTDLDARWLACYAPKLAEQVAAKRAAAIAERDRATAEAAKRAQQAPATKTKLRAPRDGESMDDWFKQHEARDAPMPLVHILWNFAVDMNEKNKERNARINALEARINNLEARPINNGAGCHWRGVWQHSLAYTEGALTTAGGSLWLCTDSSTAKRPGTDESGWTLIVKSGAFNKGSGA